MPKQRTSKAKTTQRGEFETPLVPTPEYERWLSDEADAALLAIAKNEALKLKGLSPKKKSRAKGKHENAEDRVAAAVKWECLRHLFFSGQMSDFWQCWVREGENEALARFREAVPEGKAISFAAHTPHGDVLKLPSFRQNAWNDLEECSQFLLSLHATDTGKAVSPLRDTGTEFYGLMEWACQQMKSCKTGDGSPSAMRLEIMGTGKIPERPVIDEPTHSQIILEIDWSAGIEDILRAFKETVQPLWKKRHPQGRKPRGKDPKHFFKGLVVLRRREIRRSPLRWKEATCIRGDNIFGKNMAARSSAARAVRDAEDTLAHIKKLLDEEEQRICHGWDVKKWATNLARETAKKERLMLLPVSEPDPM